MHKFARLESPRTHNYILSHLRLPNLEGQVPVFISPRNRAAQLYPQALGFLFVASSRGYGVSKFKFQLHATDGQSASSSWCRTPCGAHDQILIFFV
jgi:hypothetical protein